MNPAGVDFRPVAGSTTVIDQGNSGDAGSNDVGFDPRCIRQQSGQAVARWQYAVDYTYVASVGGVAGCFRPGPRIQGAAPDLRRGTSRQSHWRRRCRGWMGGAGGSGGMGRGGSGAGGSVGGTGGRAAPAARRTAPVESTRLPAPAARPPARAESPPVTPACPAGRAAPRPLRMHDDRARPSGRLRTARRDRAGRGVAAWKQVACGSRGVGPAPMRPWRRAWRALLIVAALFGSPAQLEARTQPASSGTPDCRGSAG